MARFSSFIKGIFSWIKKHKRITAVILMLFGIIFFIFRPKPPTPPETTTVTYTNLIQSVAVSGSIDAKTKVDLTFPAAGKLVYIGAQKGARVKKYQTIAALDQRTVEANIKNAVDAYENQKISFDIINDNNGDRLLNDLSLSTSAYRQLKSALLTLDQTKIAVTIQQIAAEQAVLTSPIDGILAKADVTVPGVVVTPTTTYTVADPSTFVFKMDVDEADIGKIATGEAVKINLDPYPDKVLTYPVTFIDFISHTTTNGANAFTVEAELPADMVNQYRIGINGNAEIITAEKDHVLTVPLAALVNDTYVYVKKGTTYEKRKISLGLQNDVNGEVISGLSKGDVVVTQPSKVTPQK